MSIYMESGPKEAYLASCVLIIGIQSSDGLAHLVTAPYSHPSSPHSHQGFLCPHPVVTVMFPKPQAHKI